MSELALDTLMQTSAVLDTDDAFIRSEMQYHVPYLINHAATRMLSLPPIEVYRFKGDFAGLLLSLNEPVPDYLHWIVARMNNIDSFTDYPDELLMLRIPDPDVYVRLINSIKAKQRLLAKK